MNEIQCRSDFPALKQSRNGRNIAFLDGPAGTQVPQQVIDAISDYYKSMNANTHGVFGTSMESDRMLGQCRQHLADFLGADSPEEISFGANMTTLTFSLARAIGRSLQPGDEILITQLDHEANRGPWLGLREYGIEVREIAITPSGTLDYVDFESKINERTRLVAMGYASNALGTVNDIKFAREMTYRFGAWLFVDAVHYAPHFPIDVSLTGMDFLVCSAYKFYGPHIGVLYCRGDMLDRLQPDRLRTQDQAAPYRIETGTLNHAALAGVSAAVDYIARFGKGKTLRSQIVSAMKSISAYEHSLGKLLYEQLNKIKPVKVWGPSFDTSLRAPTVSFTVDGVPASAVCKRLDNEGICAWDGHFYAIELGGVTRIGISMYNTREEIERLLNCLDAY
jgi:cysteine desulfurase family protein (TIGR01976 family)